MLPPEPEHSLALAGGHVGHSTGSINVGYESPILRSAVQETCFSLPGQFNPAP
jgi:hypothetical protein